MMRKVLHKCFLKTNYCSVLQMRMLKFEFSLTVNCLVSTPLITRCCYLGNRLTWKGTLQLSMWVKRSQKQPSWLISTMNSFGNNTISLFGVLYKNSVIPNTLCKIICSQSPFACCFMAILIFCLNVSCHATMNIWINCTNNKELWPLTVWSRRHLICFSFPVKGAVLWHQWNTQETFWFLFLFLQTVDDEQEFTLVKHEQLLFWINRN